MKDFIAYYRVSTTKQGNSELGLKAQQSSVHSFIQSIGGNMIDEITEIESAANKDRVKHGADINLESLLTRRPELLRAINLAKELECVLIVKEVTRLTRFCLLFNYLTATGVKFICADYPNDDTMMLGFRVQFGEEEARQISKRTKAGLAKSNKAKGTKWKENFDKINPTIRIAVLQSKAELNPNNRRAKAMVKPLVVEGKSLKEIADYLNQHSFKTSSGKQFHPMSVKRLIQKNDYTSACKQ
jgi:DNA invertase Pin-like site-specific DNA recombinase